MAKHKQEHTAHPFARTDEAGMAPQQTESAATAPDLATPVVGTTGTIPSAPPQGGPTPIARRQTTHYTDADYGVKAAPGYHVTWWAPEFFGKALSLGLMRTKVTDKHILNADEYDIDEKGFIWCRGAAAFAENLADYQERIAEKIAERRGKQSSYRRRMAQRDVDGSLVDVADEVMSVSRETMRIAPEGDEFAFRRPDIGPDGRSIPER